MSITHTGSRSRRRAGIAAAAGVVALGLACADAPTWQPEHVIREPAIREGSGIVASRQYDGVLWTHNDSGDEARIFAIDRAANLLSEVHADGATNVDWEDITTDDAGNLYIADTGNNRNTRRDLGIYVVREPDPRAGRLQSVPVAGYIPFFYPEQTGFPDSATVNFDCEGLFWDQGELYVLTKHRSDTHSALYRVPAEGGAAVRLGEFDAGGMVSAASLSPDGRRLVVLTYEAIHLFERQSPSADLLSGKHHRTVLEARQCEAICFDGDDVVFTNEQREMFRVRLAALENLDAYVPAAPRATAVHVGSTRLGWWRNVAPLPLEPDIVVCPPPAEAPAVHLGWTADGVAVRIDWRVRRDADWPECVVEILLAPAGEPPQPSDAVVYRGTLRGSSVQLSRRTAAEAASSLPSADPPTKRTDGGWSGDRLWFEAVLPVPGGALRAGDAIHAVVQVFEPATAAILAPPCGHDADAPFEWAWAGSSSTQPWTNPLLWGSVTLAGQPD
jgi:hypothetical protein